MNLRLALLSFLLAAPASRAAVVLFAEYRLGEAGSLGTNNRPLDSSGNGRDFTADVSGSSAVVVSGGASSLAGAGGVAGTSTGFLNTAAVTGTDYWSGASFSSLQTNNFAFGLFAKADSIASADIFSLGSANNAPKISLGTNGWAASFHNTAWIGNASGTSGSFVAGTWVHLALVRSAGVMTFYINGVAQGSGVSTTPVLGSGYLAGFSSGSAFDGAIDEARVITFDDGESTANVIAALQTGVSAVPEPSTYGLLGAGALAAAALVRRRRR